jgi:hypothetical protein
MDGAVVKQFDSHPSEPGVTTTLCLPMADLDTGKTDTTIYDLGSIFDMGIVPLNSTRPKVLRLGNTEKSPYAKAV